MPTCPSAPTSTRHNWPSDANFPTPHDSNPIQWLSNVCPHVFAHLRPNHQTTALSLVPADEKVTKLPLPRTPNSHSTLSRLLLQDASPPSPMPSLALGSIAAPTTASAFLQASLSKMPRSNFSLPQHHAPRHFRSRLTTITAKWRERRFPLLIAERSLCRHLDVHQLVISG